MRAGVAYCRGLSFEGLRVGRTRRDLTGRRYRPPAGSSLHHYADPRVAAAVPCDIAVGACRGHRRRPLVLHRAGTALPMALDGDGGRHDCQRGLPIDRNAIVTWAGHRLVCRSEDIDLRFRGLGLCALAVLLLHALGWSGRS